MQRLPSSKGGFQFQLSKDLERTFMFKIVKLMGTLRLKSVEELMNDPYYLFFHETEATAASRGPIRLQKSVAGSSLYITSQLWAEGEPLLPEKRTPFVRRIDKYSYSWGEWVNFPISYKNLSRQAQLCVTVWSFGEEVPVGSATISVFSKNGNLRAGSHRLYLHPGKIADGNLPTSTPGKRPSHALLEGKGDYDGFDADKLLKKYEQGSLERVGWLDSLVLQKLGGIKKRETKEGRILRLYIEFEPFAHPVLFDSDTLLQSVTHSKTIVPVHDPCIDRANPVEQKYRKQVRAARHLGGIDEGKLVPAADELSELEGILKRPPTAILTAEEQDLLWKYRYFAAREANALPKFLACVDWNVKSEVEEVSLLLSRWAPLDTLDAIELLNGRYLHKIVRDYAVEQLQKAGEETISLILLQLVQALRYETTRSSSLERFLVREACKSVEIGIDLYWYLVVAAESKEYSQWFTDVHQRYLDALKKTPDGEKRAADLSRQNALVANLDVLVKELSDMNVSRSKKIGELRSWISEDGRKSHLRDFSAYIPLPLDSKVAVSGISSEHCSMFKSALNPLKIAFRRNDDPNFEYAIVFKKGDDMRQDQLIIQMVDLMDRLLKKERLDLKLTPFKVLATSSYEGMSEFVPSRNLSRVLAEHKCEIPAIHKYFQLDHYDEEADYNISPEVLDVFVRSCAGYCVITYILGVGDRHLDNLMLTRDGRLFHIDFGYILGKDPKPFPPPMKLCKEMVEGMGGQDSPHYHQFKEFCVEAFNILRKSANLILNLFILMADSEIPDLRDDPEKNILKVQERLRLDLDDEGATQFFQVLINESVRALFPQVMEIAHRWAQYWRS